MTRYFPVLLLLQVIIMKMITLLCYIFVNIHYFLVMLPLLLLLVVTALKVTCPHLAVTVKAVDTTGHWLGLLSLLLLLVLLLLLLLLMVAVT
jgi:hypothetical protein